jgi:hypothetical protein
MIEAGKEEYNLPVEAGEVDSNRISYITVVVNGVWSKRSYKSNYNAAVWCAMYNWSQDKNSFIGMSV